MGKLMGYTRVSIRGPEPRSSARRPEEIYQHTISGTKSRRPGLNQALENPCDGDTLMGWKLDRLGRSVKDLLDFAAGLSERGIGFVSLTDAIDTTTASKRANKAGSVGANAS